jgi:hypothetical protein
MILESLEEAQAVYSRHLAEQKEAGENSLNAWLTVRKDTLRIVVRDYRGEHPMSTCYEYDLWFDCAGIHEIEKGARRKPFKYSPLRQLHMFANA